MNSERAEYLRYLSGKTEEIRAAANAQKASAEWSHPDPDVLEAVLDGPRMWERGASDPDYLHIRIGRDEVALSAGFGYAPGATVTLQVEQTGLDFYTAQPQPGRNAFARDGKAAIAAMQKAKEAQARSPGPREARVVDTFSLRGFSAAYAAINKACPAK